MLRKTKVRRSPTFTTDRDGTIIVRVPLAAGYTAEIEREVWKRILDAGVSPNWTYNVGVRRIPYVRCHRPGDKYYVQVARLIVCPPEGHYVRYRDGNRLNLRRANLYAEPSTSGRAGIRETEHMANAPA